MIAKLKKAAHAAHSQRAGMTLVEVVVAMAVCTIVMGALVGMIYLIFRSYTTGEDQANAQNLAVLTMQKIENTVRYESTVTIADAGAVSGAPKAIYYDASKNGIKMGDYTYLGGSYKNYYCVLNFSNENSNPDITKKNNLLKIEITIYKGTAVEADKKIFNTTGSVYLLNGHISGDNQNAISF